MIIEDATWKYYAPDSASVLDPKTGKYSLDSTQLLPYDLHILKEDLILKQAEINNIIISDADLLIWANQNHPEMQYKTMLQDEVNTLRNDIKNYKI